MTKIKAFSFGGGVQSTAALVLAARGEIDYKDFIFADVGEDSENPHTIEYVEKVSRPFAAEHGLNLETVRYTVFKEPATLVQEIHRRKSSYVIPVHFEKSGMGRRRCTYDFKIKPVAKWLKAHGATKTDPGICALGISFDEGHRQRTYSGFDYYTNEYPLVELRLHRRDCEQIVRNAGLPVPPKSSCYFCPFHGVRAWEDLKKNEPELFQKSIELEKVLSDRMQAKQGVPVFLSGRRKSLNEAFAYEQEDMFGDDPEATCDTGSCFT